MSVTFTFTFCHLLLIVVSLVVSTISFDCLEMIRYVWSGTTGAALPENNEASTELTTANGEAFISSSARLSSQSRYSTLDQ